LRNLAKGAMPPADSSWERFGVGARSRTERQRDTPGRSWLGESAELSRLNLAVWAYFSFLRRTFPSRARQSMG